MSIMYVCMYVLCMYEGLCMYVDTYDIAF